MKYPEIILFPKHYLNVTLKHPEIREVETLVVEKQITVNFATFHRQHESQSMFVTVCHW